MKSSSKKYLYWLAFMLCFCGIPILLVTYGLFYLNNQKQNSNLEKHQSELNRLYRTLEPVNESEVFWCNFLSDKLNGVVINKEKGTAAIIEKIVELRRILRFNYIIYSDKAGIERTSMPMEPEEDWKSAISMLWKFFHHRDNQITDLEQEAAGRVFGPQIYWEHLNNAARAKDRYFTWPDSKLQKPLLWANWFNGRLVIILIDLDELKSNDGIWNFLENFRKESVGLYDFAIVEGNQSIRYSTTAASFSAQIDQAWIDYKTQKSSIIKTRNLVVFPRFLTANLTVLGFINQEENTDYSLRLPGLMLGIFLIIVAGALGRYSHNMIVCDVPDRLSLRWKLRFLFFFANGLPLLVLFFIGTDYLNQKRDNLIRESHGKGISFLQDFDEKIEIEFAKTLVDKKKAEQHLLNRLANEELTNDNLLEFVSQLGSQTWKVALIASKSHVIGTEDGIIDEKRGMIPRDSNSKSGEISKNQMDFTRKIGQFFLDKINGVTISEKVATEIELLMESVTQKPLNNFIYELLLHRGNFIQWGFGQNVHPSILDTFYRNGSTSADYFFLATFKRVPFQFNFLEKRLPVANRNHLGLRVIALLDNQLSLPKSAFSDQQIREFASTLTSYPGKEIKTLDFQEKNDLKMGLKGKYLAMGFKGKFINDFQLIGLYPLENIDSVISHQKRQLLIFAFFSLLMTFGLAQVLAQGFLLPLQLITTGAMAIEGKNFQHRLPDLGHDEFGAMGKIFNNVMVDLEELSVASAIQEQLLPQGSINTGNFSLFGRTVSMGALGGDYYDHIELDNNRFSVLLGDVAGHGVGAALIMAMAKAGIIQSEHLLSQPLALLTRLHSLILASKTKKQRKVMTFQYLCLDSLSGKGIYANAGACSPILIREKANVAEELTLAGAALGAFKKANFSEVEIAFAPGDAIVFYTDGIVEARNRAGKELGYDNLKKLLKKSWDSNAETYYNNIFRAYLEHIGDEGAQDDLTMVILVYSGPQAAQFVEEKPAVDV